MTVALKLLHSAASVGHLGLLEVVVGLDLVALPGEGLRRGEAADKVQHLPDEAAEQVTHREVQTAVDRLPASPLQCKVCGRSSQRVTDL